jgi:hypothetical protein
MGILHGRARRSAARNGGFRPGQFDAFVPEGAEDDDV